MDILLTNDDSHNSPLFRFAIDFVKTLGEVTIVVPKHEQSWTGKSMSRFHPLSVSQMQLQGDTVYCVDGTPADCVNIGVYHLCPKPPDLVVSGINIGVNAGIGYLFSSGTVGACLEANVAGRPAIALSQSLAPPVFQALTHHRHIEADEEARLRTQTVAILERVFQTLLRHDDMFQRPVTWNVNLPYAAAPDWHLVPTVIGHTVYGSCFQPHGEQFRHAGGTSYTDRREHTDGMVVQRGQVSVTCIDMRQLGQTIVPL